MFPRLFAARGAARILTALAESGTSYSILTKGTLLGRDSALLAGAGVAIDAQTAPTARLSGGQKARLAMLLLGLMARLPVAGVAQPERAQLLGLVQEASYAFGVLFNG